VFWLENFEQRLNGLEIRLAVTEKRVDVLEENIKKIEDNTAWAVKLIIGQTLIGIIGFIFLNGGM
jgi:hypothetical protein